jgi:hypothetical protein
VRGMIAAAPDGAAVARVFFPCDWNGFGPPGKRVRGCCTGFPSRSNLMPKLRASSEGSDRASAECCNFPLAPIRRKTQIQLGEGAA